MFLGVFKINVYNCFFVDAKIRCYISVAKNKKMGFPQCLVVIQIKQPNCLNSVVILYFAAIVCRHNYQFGCQHNKVKIGLANLFCADNQVLLILFVSYYAVYWWVYSKQFLFCTIDMVQIIKSLCNTKAPFKQLFLVEHFLSFSEK